MQGNEQEKQTEKPVYDHNLWLLQKTVDPVIRIARVLL